MQPPMPLTELATRIGVSKSSLARYESGESPMPQNVLAVAAEVLGVDQVWLETGEGDGPFSAEVETSSLSMEAIRRLMQGAGLTYTWMARQIDTRPQIIQGWLEKGARPRDPFAGNRMLAAILKHLSESPETPLDVPAILNEISSAYTGDAAEREMTSIPLVRSYTDLKKVQETGVSPSGTFEAEPDIARQCLFAFQVSGDDSGPGVLSGDVVFIAPSPDGPQTGVFGLWADHPSKSLMLRRASAGQGGLILPSGDNTPAIPAAELHYAGKAYALRRDFGGGRRLVVVDPLGLSRTALGA